MKKKLGFRESLLVGSLLFGLFFGAGNLIFPTEIGQNAGYNVSIVTIGFLLTAVLLPLIGVSAFAISGSENVFEMASPVSDIYAYLYTSLLYLSIGPLFSIPRTAAVSFEVSARSFYSGDKIWIVLLIYTIIFFAIALYFSLRPGKILDVIGKFLTPTFLILLSILIIASLVNPMGGFGDSNPISNYEEFGLAKGFIDGYSTLDAVASLAFGIIIISNIKKLGVEEPGDIARETFKSGIVCLILMSVIYLSLTYMGSTSLGVMDRQENGAIVLSKISQFYFGNLGKILISAIVIITCLKTAIGLITAISEMFYELTDKKIKYNTYVICFTLWSFITANFGLSAIIKFSIPVLMLLYPLSIALITLALFSHFIGTSKTVYQWTIGFTLFAAIFDMINALPDSIKSTNFISKILEFSGKFLPGFNIGFGWVVPAIIGFIIGVILKNRSKN